MKFLRQYCRVPIREALYFIGARSRYNSRTKNGIAYNNWAALMQTDKSQEGLSEFYSVRKASTGLTEAARRAGK